MYTTGKGTKTAPKKSRQASEREREKLIKNQVRKVVLLTEKRKREREIMQQRQKIGERRRNSSEPRQHKKMCFFPLTRERETERMY
jgi:hypothetical protein